MHGTLIHVIFGLQNSGVSGGQWGSEAVWQCGAVGGSAGLSGAVGQWAVWEEVGGSGGTGALWHWSTGATGWQCGALGQWSSDLHTFDVAVEGDDEDPEGGDVWSFHRT